MSKHLLEKPAPKAEPQLSHFIHFERRERVAGPHPAVAALYRRPRPQPGPQRAKAYLKIEATQE